MTAAAPAANTPQKPWLLWTGRILSALPVLTMGFAATMAFARTPQVVEGMSKFGWPEDTLLLIGVLELGSALIYLIPRTAPAGPPPSSSASSSGAASTCATSACARSCRCVGRNNAWVPHVRAMLFGANVG